MVDVDIIAIDDLESVAPTELDSPSNQSSPRSPDICSSLPAPAGSEVTWERNNELKTSPATEYGNHDSAQLRELPVDDAASICGKRKLEGDTQGKCDSDSCADSGTLPLYSCSYRTSNDLKTNARVSSGICGEAATEYKCDSDACADSSAHPLDSCSYHSSNDLETGTSVSSCAGIANSRYAQQNAPQSTSISGNGLVQQASLQGARAAGRESTLNAVNSRGTKRHQNATALPFGDIKSSKDLQSLDQVFKVARQVESTIRANAARDAKQVAQTQKRERRQRSKNKSESQLSGEVADPPKYEPVPRGGLVELRKDRREREAAFRLGELKAKPPVIHIDGSAIGSSSSKVWWMLDALRPTLQEQPLQVLLPLQPTEAQRVVARHACEAMGTSGCALLEAPTGTGKTLAVLGTALAWQWSEAQRLALLNSNQTCPRDEKSKSALPSTSSEKKSPPRVIWVARTHEQLLHAVHEFRRLPYRPLMSLRLSRERFCLHPNVRTARNKAEACEVATTIAPRKAPKRRGGQAPRSEGCSYLERAEAIRYPQAPQHRRRFELGGPLATYDIEDLVQEAHAQHICPFHAVGDLAMEGAGLVFITYNQLLDPLVRFAGGYEPLFQDAIICVDEAHNLPGEAQDVASFVATAQELDDMRSHFEELALKLPDEKCQKLAKRLVLAVAQLHRWLVGLDLTPGRPKVGPGGAPLKPYDKKPSVYVASGSECLALAKHCELESVKQVDRHIQDLKRLRKDLMWAGLESTAVRSSFVNELESFLWKMRFVLDGGSNDYRLVVEPGPRVQFLCLRGAVAWEPAVRAAKSVLLLSGTLSPFDVIVHELGLRGRTAHGTQAPDSMDSSDSNQAIESRQVRPLYTCQAPHHGRLDKMCIARAVGSIGRVALDSRLRCRSESYFDALGEAVRTVSSAIPNGTVVFLPSYVLVEALIARLRHSGQFTALTAGRQIFVEERGDSSSKTLSAYRAAALAGPAILFAVMRGKIAEGTDLRDAEARCCIVVGIPYPQLSIEVELRRQAPGGTRWYEAEAMRQVSQAAGRLLRHQHDFGSVILLDQRYAAQQSPLLAPWLRGLLRTADIAGTHADLKVFFDGRCS